LITDGKRKMERDYYGCKNHEKVDSMSKFIRKFAVTDASVNDSQPQDDLICI
jgi:hypothetical protein